MVSRPTPIQSSQVMREVKENDLFVFFRVFCGIIYGFWSVSKDQEFNNFISSCHPGRQIINCSVCTRTSCFTAQHVLCLWGCCFLLHNMEGDRFHAHSACSSQTWTNTDSDRLSKLSRGQTSFATVMQRQKAVHQITSRRYFKNTSNID